MHPSRTDSVVDRLYGLLLVVPIVVASVSSTLVILLSALGIPASFVIIVTISIVDLG